MLTRLWIWFAVSYFTLADRWSARRRDDRGDALATAAITVGLVIIAGVVIAILRQKATSTANNVCTSADPTTCK